MLEPFLLELRAAGVPVSLTELLTLLEALRQGVAQSSAQDFYHLARTCLVKDERHYDRFDRVFAQTFDGAQQRFAQWVESVPEEWLKALTRRTLQNEARSSLASVGGWDELLASLRETLREQSGRHEGGSRWIGTAGTSPYGTAGLAAQGVRIGRPGSGASRAFKVWERREYRDLDDAVELGTRNIKVALRKLRKLAREGAVAELDLDGTIRATARNAGLLELKWVPQRRNTARVLLFLDVGGSMQAHVRICEELFSAARSELKHLEHFYFHNFLYEHLWRHNPRHRASMISTAQVLRTYSREYHVIFVGDATMSPYEIIEPGGSIEHSNPEAGALWMERVAATFPRLVWLNPASQALWEHTPSVQIARRLTGGRMFPLTIEGLEEAIGELRRPLVRAVAARSSGHSSLAP